MDKLLPCPFCGGEAELHDGVVIIPVIDENGAYIDADVEDTPAWVECAACGAATDGVDSADKAIAAWNRRAQPENSRQHALQTGVCPMCEDCPDGCPVEAPNDSRNKPENEPLTLDELIQRCTPKAAELLKRGLFGAVKVCAVDETIQKTNADRIRGMDREHQIEAVAEGLCDWAGVGGKEGSYIYDLTRCKSAFGVGTMSFDDFQELEEDRCFEVAAEFVDWLRQPSETEGTE